MATPDQETSAKPKKMAIFPILAGLALAGAGGAGGYVATNGGMILGQSGTTNTAPLERTNGLTDIAFVEIEPLVISIGAPADRHLLRFRGYLEVAELHRSDVEKLMPRIVDALNEYLRAVQVSDLEAVTSIIRLRTHMLRRVQLVTGEGRVRDLLIMEFILT